MKITYLGQCGFLIEGGNTRIVTDPYLSCYVDKHFYSEITPWKRLYPAPAALAELRPVGVLISHAHSDHMDPETIGQYLKAGGQAVFSAPAPEIPALKALGVQDMIAARAENPFTIGGATITPIACAHTQFHKDDMGRFHELSYLIELDGTTIFFGGDMSLYDGLDTRLARADCDLLLLPVNGRDEARTANGIIGNIDAAEAANLAARLSAPFIPMHHDLYAINGCTPETIAAAAQAAGSRAIALRPMESCEISGGVVRCFA